MNGGKVTIHGLGSLGSLGSGLWAPGLWAPWAPWALGSGQDVLGSRVYWESRDYWAPWAPKQESALSL